MEEEELEELNVRALFDSEDIDMDVEGDDTAEDDPEDDDEVIDADAEPVAGLDR